MTGIFILLTPGIVKSDLIDSIEELDGTKTEPSAEKNKKEPKKTKPDPNMEQPSSVDSDDHELSPDEKSSLGNSLLPGSESTEKSDSKSSSPSPNPPKSSQKASDHKKVNQDAERRRRAKSPINIKSSGRTTYSRNGGLVHLRKDVVITQEDLRLQADEAKVYVNDGNTEDRIDKVEFTGEVKFTKFDSLPSEQVSAHGDRAIFLNEAQTVTLIGNARIWKGNQLIRGKRIVYDIQTGMIEVDQAVGVVHPEEAKP